MASTKKIKPAAKSKPAAKAPKAVKAKAVKVKAAPILRGPSLVVVESPAKERTISRFLKDKSNEFVVRSSYGHVCDLPLRKLGVGVDKGFEPEYVVLPRAKKILLELSRLAAKSPWVYLATDHDREGESIAWHLADLLKVPPERVRRITFHEITPTAIAEALENPRSIDSNLVRAQQARRIIDRLVGYKLSPLLWAKIQRGLSAGRVQSAAVRLLAEREAEITQFQSTGFWSVGGRFEKSDFPPTFEARLSHWKGQKVELIHTYDLFAEPYRVKETILKTEGDVRAIEEALKGASFRVSKLEKKEVKRRPAPPFATSTLQQAASQTLGFAAERTMRIAQSLYEGVDLGGGEAVGLITYMRTDSFSVSKSAADATANFMRETFGPEFVPDAPPVYQTKSRSAQEAHEAIRPTDVLRLPDDLKTLLSPEQQRLYDLIWKRFVASQMKEAVYDTVGADVEGGEAVFRVTGRSLKFEGYLKVYGVSAQTPDKEDDESEENGDEKEKLPELAEGDSLSLVSLKTEERHTSPPPKYNEASLIRALEKHGIGRPSTYAPTIKTIADRGYARRGIKDRTLAPTQLGLLVTEKLKAHFPDVVSLGYTADVEGKLDEIAEGRLPWASVVEGFYGPFLTALEKAFLEMEVSKVEPKKSDEKCPLCASPMLIRESRFGKYLSCTEFPRCKGKVRLDENGQKIVLETTGDICELCAKPMVIRVGRKGKFLACSGYPACKNTYSLDAEGKKIPGSRPVLTKRLCNKCERPFYLRLGKKGSFLACSGFPKCRNLKPVAKDVADELRKEEVLPVPVPVPAKPAGE